MNAGTQLACLGPALDTQSAQPYLITVEDSHVRQLPALRLR